MSIVETASELSTGRVNPKRTEESRRRLKTWLSTRVKTAGGFWFVSQKHRCPRLDRCSRRRKYIGQTYYPGWKADDRAARLKNFHWWARIAARSPGQIPLRRGTN